MLVGGASVILVPVFCSSVVTAQQELPPDSGVCSSFTAQSVQSVSPLETSGSSANVKVPSVHVLPRTCQQLFWMRGDAPVGPHSGLCTHGTAVGVLNHAHNHTPEDEGDEDDV